MSRGIYTAGSGLLTLIRDINVRSNNIANVGTTGFKEDRLVTTTFAEAVAIRQEIRTVGEKVEIGTNVRGKKAVDIKTDFNQGGLEFTSRSLDFAIAGDGFFTILYTDENDQEAYYYTRNGQFQIDDEGYLVFGERGHYVADDTGSRILVETSNFMVDEYGVIFDAYEDEIATLGIFVPSNLDLLIKKDDEVFSLPWDLENETPYELDELDFTGVVRQGYTERSNVDMATQMAALISDSRSYQSLTQIIKTIDAIKNKSANELGRV